MNIKLQNDSPLSEIKRAFHAKFPFLKLEFFYPGETEKDNITKSNLITDDSKTLGEIAELDKPGYVNMNEYQSVKAVEQCFRSCFGIHAQVFRKSGDNWIETTTSDERLLADLNAKGEGSEQPFRPEYIPDDIHEQQ